MKNAIAFLGFLSILLGQPATYVIPLLSFVLLYFVKTIPKSSWLLIWITVSYLGFSLVVGFLFSNIGFNKLIELIKLLVLGAFIVLFMYLVFTDRFINATKYLSLAIIIASSISFSEFFLDIHWMESQTIKPYYIGDELVNRDFIQLMYANINSFNAFWSFAILIQSSSFKNHPSKIALMSILLMSIVLVLNGSRGATIVVVASILQIISSKNILKGLFPALLVLPTLDFSELVIFKRLVARGFQDLERLELFENGWSLFVNSPIFGYGWGSFTSVYEINFPKLLSSPHNFLIESLVETGLFGTILFLSFIYSFTRNCKHQTLLVMGIFVMGCIDSSFFSSSIIFYLIGYLISNVHVKSVPISAESISKNR